MPVPSLPPRACPAITFGLVVALAVVPLAAPGGTPARSTPSTGVERVAERSVDDRASRSQRRALDLQVALQQAAEAETQAAEQQAAEAQAAEARAAEQEAAFWREAAAYATALQAAEAEAAEMARALSERLIREAVSSRGRSRVPALSWPAAGGITGSFGERRPGHMHAGIDIDGNTGDPVWAAGAGVVVLAGGAPSGYSGYGTMVVIDHGYGMSTLYAHLSRLDVRPGASVKAGERVGSVGSTGNSTGSHLHFEVRINGATVDPRGHLPGR